MCGPCDLASARDVRVSVTSMHRYKLHARCQFRNSVTYFTDFSKLEERINDIPCHLTGVSKINNLETNSISKQKGEGRGGGKKRNFLPSQPIGDSRSNI